VDKLVSIDFDTLAEVTGGKASSFPKRNPCPSLWEKKVGDITRDEIAIATAACGLPRPSLKDIGRAKRILF
jgi:hypothetical protein